MNLNSNAAKKAMVKLSMPSYCIYGDVIDETSFKKNIKIKVGINTVANENILGEPTCSYEDFKKEYDAFFAIEPMERLREVRNHKLSKTDWSQSSDVPDSLKTKYQTYRQELRDLPAQSGINPKIDDVDGMLIDSSINWPNEPS